MLPDLRLLISATVATFFLAATGGLYASMRITQDQLAARIESRATMEETPIARIAANWPTPEPDRIAAMRELMRIAKAPSVAATEPADMPEAAETETPATETPVPETPVPETAITETPAVAAELPAAAAETQPAPTDEPAHDNTGSTGTAALPDVGLGVTAQSEQADVQGNVSDAPAVRPTTAMLDKAAKAVKKAPVRKTKSAKVVHRRKQIARTPTPVLPRLFDPWLTNNYPLYLTVPVTN